MAEEIRKGIGCSRLESLVNQILIGDEPEQIQEDTVILIRQHFSGQLFKCVIYRHSYN
jgi:hypothetical protein